MGTVCEIDRGTAEVLLVTCIDFRFVGLYPRWMARLGFAGRYDHICTYGASLALSGVPTDCYKTVLQEQIGAAREIHRIRKIILADHEDCGAYFRHFGAAPHRTSLEERGLHRVYLEKARESLREAYPELTVELYYAKRDGEFESVA